MQLSLFKSLSDQIEDGDNKTCNKCHRLLPLTAFSMHSASNYQRPECKKCNNELSIIRSNLRKGVEPPDKNHVCPICLSTENQVAGKGNKKNGSWVLDHDHSSNSFRGWLCHKCNRGLGAFNDNLEHLENAIKYLREDRYDMGICSSNDPDYPCNKG